MPDPDAYRWYRFTPESSPRVEDGAIHCLHEGRTVVVRCDRPAEAAAKMGPDCEVEILVESERASGVLTGMLAVLVPATRDWSA